MRNAWVVPGISSFTLMSNVITEYQRWKQQGESLRSQARSAIEVRFKELLNEAAQLAEEYRADFGKALKPPPNITAFRYKAGSRPKPKKAAKAGAAKTEVKAEPRKEAAAPQQDKKTTGLLKRLAAAKKKLDETKAAGQPTRNLEDKVYEIEDELRLAGYNG